MGGDDHDALLREAADQFADLVLLVRIEPVGGLVEHQRPRFVEDRLGQADTPAEALGEGFDGLPAHLIQFQQPQCPGDPLALAGTTVATDLGDEIEEALHGHFRVAGRTFREVADQPLRLQRAVADVEAENARGAGAGRQEAGEHLHGGGLAGAVRTEEAQYLPVATWKDRSSTATREPKRLPRFLVSIMVPYLFRRPPPCPARAAKNAQGL